VNRDDELVVRIRGNGKIDVEQYIDGVISHKPIAPNSFMECINKSLFRGGVSSGMLPPGCLSVNFHDSGVRSVTLLHTANRADISYMKTEYKNFPLPRLVFGFYVSEEGRVSDCRLGVIANHDNLKPTTPMFIYPFSNVSGTSLCIGNNPLPRVKSLHTLGSLPYLILGMDNNNHSFYAKNNKQNLEMRDMLELLKDKEQSYYYEHILLPSKKTLADFIAE